MGCMNCCGNKAAVLILGRVVEGGNVGGLGGLEGDDEEISDRFTE